MDNNSRISFIEYLLIHFKVLVLTEFYKRHEINPVEDLTNDGIGIVGVGDKLLEELFEPKSGLPAELVAAIEEFTAKKREKEKKVKDLEAKAAAGGVKGAAATNELSQLEASGIFLSFLLPFFFFHSISFLRSFLLYFFFLSFLLSFLLSFFLSFFLSRFFSLLHFFLLITNTFKDKTELNRLEITLNAAKRKASKGSADAALDAKKKKEEAERKKAEEEARQKMVDRKKLWEQV